MVLVTVMTNYALILFIYTFNFQLVHSFPSSANCCREKPRYFAPPALPASEGFKRFRSVCFQSAPDSDGHKLVLLDQCDCFESKHKLEKWGWESCLWVHVFLLRNFVMASGCIPWSRVRRFTSGLVRYCHQTQSFVFPWNASFVTKKIPGKNHFESLKLFDTTDRKKALRCFSVFGSICRNVDIVLSICEWRRNTLIDVEQSDKAHGWAHDPASHDWQEHVRDWRPWSWSNKEQFWNSKDSSFSNDSAEEKKACPLNSWRQNWRNKALQDEDKPSCQEGGWNYVFLLVSLVLNPFCLDPWKRSLQRLTLTWS